MLVFLLLHKRSFDRANFILGFASSAAHFMAQRNLISYRRAEKESSGEFQVIYSVLEISVDFNASNLQSLTATQPLQTSQTTQPNESTRKLPPTLGSNRLAGRS